MIADEQAVLGRITPAADKLSPQVHLFPTPGATPGCCSLLLVPPTRTIAVTGDAVISRDHFEHGAVSEQSHDLAQAKESLGELLEIADVFVPGHDNVVFPIR